jgi:hypothetical protein
METDRQRWPLSDDPVVEAVAVEVEEIREQCIELIMKLLRALCASASLPLMYFREYSDRRGAGTQGLVMIKIKRGNPEFALFCN